MDELKQWYLGIKSSTPARRYALFIHKLVKKSFTHYGAPVLTELVEDEMSGALQFGYDATKGVKPPLLPGRRSHR